MQRRFLFWAAALVLLVILGAGFMGPLSSAPRFELILPDRAIPDQVVPASPAPDRPAEETPTEPHPVTGHAAIAAIVMLVTVAAYLMARLLLRLRRTREPDDAPTDHPVDVSDLPGPAAANIRAHLRNAAELLTGPRDSAEAVVQCWLQLEAATANLGRARKPAETPTEYTAGILLLLDVSPSDTSTLLRAYERVRFGTTAQARAVSAAELREVREALDRVSGVISSSMNARSGHDNA